VTFAFIAAEKAQFPIDVLCTTLGVSRSGFYAWMRRPDCARVVQDRRLRYLLRIAHAETRGRYGSPRLQRELRDRGHRIGRNRVMRLMRLDQLRGRTPRRFRVTTTADPSAAAVPNVLQQRFTTRRIDEVWAGDITAIPTRDGWVYLAVLLDLCSRAIVGWAVRASLEADVVLAAWRMAIGRRHQAPRLHHSDRGRQYTSLAYQAQLRQHRVQCSMSRPGNCYDNAPVESFFRTLKTELADRPWLTRHDAARAIGDYIERFYNTKRLHSALNYRSPATFEAALREAV
jgi:transposase InsO family protein